MVEKRLPDSAEQLAGFGYRIKLSSWFGGVRAHPPKLAGARVGVGEGPILFRDAAV